MSAVGPEALAGVDRPRTSTPGGPTTQRSANDTRIPFVDNARAIGIVLVVLGHAPSLPGTVSDVIFAFHMPLFFVLSGMMIGGARLGMSTPRRVAALARSLLLPYLFYFVVSFAYWLIAKRHGLRSDEFEALPWWDPLLRAVRGDGDDYYVNVVLWFFPCLFFTALAHHLLRKALSATSTAVLCIGIATLYAALHAPDAARWPWSLDCAVVATGFYAAGAALHPLMRQAFGRDGRFVRLGIGIAAGAVCLLFVGITGHVDLNHLSFGRLPWLYVPMSIAGIVACFAIATLMPATRLAHWLSTNTLVIFPLHFLFFSVLTGVGIVVFDLQPAFKNGSPWIAPAYTVLALLICWPAERFLQQVAPWIFARRRSVNAAPDAIVVPHE